MVIGGARRATLVKLVAPFFIWGGRPKRLSSAPMQSLVPMNLASGSPPDEKRARTSHQFKEFSEKLTSSEQSEFRAFIGDRYSLRSEKIEELGNM